MTAANHVASCFPKASSGLMLAVMPGYIEVLATKRHQNLDAAFEVLMSRVGLKRCLFTAGVDYRWPLNQRWLS